LLLDDVAFKQCIGSATLTIDRNLSVFSYWTHLLAVLRSYRIETKLIYIVFNPTHVML